MDRSTLEAALLGFQLQRKQVEEKITELRRQVGGRDASAVAVLRPAAAKKAQDAARRRWCINSRMTCPRW
jgi:hypothetical protein